MQTIFQPVAVGVPWVLPSTAIFVASSDESVMGFKVTVFMRDALGQEVRQTLMIPVMSSPFTWPAVFYVQESAITKVQITRLRDAGTVELR